MNELIFLFVKNVLLISLFVDLFYLIVNNLLIKCYCYK